MRATWSGTISFGLINIPINLYPGSEEHGIRLHMLHKKDLSPIRFARICKSEDKEVPYQEIVKGYEFDKGEYVVLEDEDFARVHPKKTKTLEIECFVDEKEIDPIYFEKPYFLEPGKGAAKTYVLLNEALKKSGKVGIVTYVLHMKSHIGIIKSQGRGIILEQLRYASEIRNFAEIELPVAKILPKELEIALKLIDQLTEPFKPENYKDNYLDELQAVIEEKTKGKGRKKIVEPQVTQVGDILEKLKASLTKYKPVSKTTRVSKSPRIRKKRSSKT